MGHKIAPGRKPHPKIAVYRNLRSRIRIRVSEKRSQTKTSVNASDHETGILSIT